MLGVNFEADILSASGALLVVHGSPRKIIAERLVQTFFLQAKHLNASSK
jgi:hypothetical protein